MNKGGRPAKKRQRLGCHSGSGRGNKSDPVPVQIQICEPVTIVNEGEKKYCEEKDEDVFDTNEKPIDDMFYMLLYSTDLADLISSNLCSKDHVAFGFSTMLNEFTDMISKKIELAKDKILKSDVRNRRDYNQLIDYVFDFDFC